MNDTVNETIAQVTEVVVPSLGIVLPFTGHPTLDMFIITLFTTLFTTLIHKYMTDQIAIKALRKEMKEIQKKYRKIGLDPNASEKDRAKAAALQKEILSKNMANMKHMFKPMLISFLPLIIVFFYIQEYYALFGTLVDLGFISFGWFWTYVLFSLICSLVLRKALNVA